MQTPETGGYNRGRSRGNLGNGKEVSQAVEEHSEPGGKGEISGPSANRTSALSPTEALIEDLFSSDYATRVDAVRALQRLGREGADAMVAALLRMTDPAGFPALTFAIEELGPIAAEPVIRALGTLEIRRERDMYLVECLLDALRRLWSRRVASAIAALVDRFDEVVALHRNSVLAGVARSVQLKALAILGEFGDRSRLDALMQRLQEEPVTLRPEVLAAVQKIGDRRALRPLLQTARTVGSSCFQQDVKEAIRVILKREGLDADSPALGDLSPEEKECLWKMFPRARLNGNGNGHAAQPVERAVAPTSGA